MNLILFAGCVAGFISVAFGAYAEHGLQYKIDPETFRFLMTAIRYNEIYAVLATGAGLAMMCTIPKPLAVRVFWAGIIFMTGIILFSFSIYLAAVTGLHSLLKIAPAGGVTFMIGCLVLASASLKKSPV